jgi:hypothetical protein
MKLPNSTKKWEMRPTLNTFKIMSLIKREMKAPQVKFLLTATRLREMIALESEKWTHTI